MTLEQYSQSYPDTPLLSESGRSKFSTNSLEHFTSRYGAMGDAKYEEHKQFLALKNTYEYKRERYGWSELEFEEYNKNRAVTRENMIRRYGEVDGNARWESYVNRQRTAGITLDWFVSKYGQRVGEQVYRDVCNAKRHTLDNYIARHGADVGVAKFNEWADNRSKAHSNFSSIQERDFVLAVRECMEIGKDDCYDITTKQFTSWCPINKRLYTYDLVVPKLKLCVEYNGDYWHCNPTKYSSTYVHPHRGIEARRIWDIDGGKVRHMQDRGFRVIVVWESDWKANYQAVLKEINECLTSK